MQISKKHKNTHVIRFPLGRKVKKPLEINPPKKVSSIKTIYSSKGTRTSWETFGKKLMFPTPSEKREIRNKPFAGILSEEESERRQGFKELEEDPNFRLWKINRRTLAEKHLSKDHVTRIKDLVKKANKSGHNFWWDISLNDWGQPRLLMSYDINPEKNHSPNRELSLSCSPEYIHLDQRWSHPSCMS